jgi:tetratricopeptide (TPR) repeat protein
LVRAKALSGVGSLAYLQGDHSPSRAFHEQSLAIARELGDRWAISASPSNLGCLASDQGDFLAARALHDESHAIRRELGDRWGIAASVNNLAVLARLQRDYPAARALCEGSVAIYRELGERRGIAAGLDQMGLMACDQRDYPSAQALLKNSLVIFLELGDRFGMADVLGAMAYANTLDRSGRVARIWGAAERLREELSAPVRPADRPSHELRVAGARAAFGDDAAFDLAWAEGRTMRWEEAARYALEADPFLRLPEIRKPSPNRNDLQRARRENIAAPACDRRGRRRWR